jgi:membrane-bound ClpP family serine protease
MPALGIVLIVIAIGLFIGELHTGSGLLLLAATAILIFDMVLMYNQGVIFHPMNWWVVVPLIILFLAFITFSIWRIIVSHQRQPTTGKEDLKGKTVIVKQTLDPVGMVLYEGELWNAISNSGKIESGEEVTIERVDGMNLYVVRKPKP